MTAPEPTRELDERIAASDPRVPRVAPAGEAGVARDGAALRGKSVEPFEEVVSVPVRLFT